MSVKAGSGERGREIECVLDASGMDYRVHSATLQLPRFTTVQWESAVMDGTTTWPTMYVTSMCAHTALSQCPVTRSSPVYALLFPRVSELISFSLPRRPEDHSAGVTTH